jgi:hypothetical protein
MSKQTDLIRVQLDKIYDNAAQVAKAFDSNSIAISTLSVILDKSKLPIKGELKVFNQAWNKTITLLNKSCVTIADKQTDKRVPLNVFKMYIGIIKDNLDK